MKHFYIIMVLMIALGSCLSSDDIKTIPLYGTFEESIYITDVSGIKFDKYIEAEFNNGENCYSVKGFYYGNDTWKIRFMPDQPGVWNFQWKFETQSGSGKFRALAKPLNPLVHGHVQVKDNHLAYDDSTMHYWFGGKWIRAQNYGPAEKRGLVNEYYYSDSIFISYFNHLKEFKHNGTLLKFGLYPLEDDGETWDTTWINRADWVIRELGKRGIYCHLNIFDTWGRGKDSVFHTNTYGEKQVFNVWAEDKLPQKNNYIKYLVSRFSSYYNVYWELGNEMEHKPNDGDSFSELANKYYIPWIRKYDPYGLPICLSEGIWKKTDVDIGLCHNPWGYPTELDTIPVIHNELVFRELEGFEDAGPALGETKP